MNEPVHITKPEAVEAVRARAFTTDEGRAIVHCFSGTLGADWDLDGVVSLIEGADDIAWLPNIFGHELAVLAEGRIRSFDVKAPAGVLP